jgi:capsular polysaccharide transport system ATP-binding protein
MIRLRDVNKIYPTGSGPVQILSDINFTVRPGERVGVLGRNGAGKSTLIRLVSGAELPTSGIVERAMSVSWPLAFGGAFQGSLTGLDNLRFICRIYGADPEDKIQFVEEFSELGLYLREPVKSYSSGMRARLAFALSMVIEFDCFLIDEIIAVGDARFHERCNHELFTKRGDRAMIIVSHDAGYIREHCSRASVISGGRLHHFDTLDEAFGFYSEAFPTTLKAA